VCGPKHAPSGPPDIIAAFVLALAGGQTLSPFLQVAEGLLTRYLTRTFVRTLRSMSAEDAQRPLVEAIEGGECPTCGHALTDSAKKP
jgi:hypothetical protein